MGYYTWVYLELPLKKDITKEKFFELVQEYEEKHPNTLVESKRFMVNSGCVEFTDGEFSTSWIDEFQNVCDFLAPLVEEGSMNCDGEENDDFWMVVFDGCGNWERIDGQRIYGSVLDTFLQRYEDKLPKDVVTKIKSLRVAERL